MNKKLAAVMVLAGTCLLFSPKSQAQAAASQQPSASADQTAKMITDQEIKLLRQDIRSKKKQLIAANLNLTDSEATKFWPVYDQYTAELSKINDQKYAMIKDYAQNWGTITDDQAKLSIRKWLDLDTAVTQLRAKYVPIVNQVLPGKKMATFFQMDRRISMLMDVQLSSQVPFVQDQP